MAHRRWRCSRRGSRGGIWLGGRGGPAVAPSFRRLTFRRGLIRSARVAPDGQTILHGALWDGGPCRVYTGRLDSPESRPLDLPEANVLAISRSGELALSIGAHLDGVVTYGTLARVPIAGGTPREMVENVKFADWSPDGADLAIVRRVDGRDRLEYPIGTASGAAGRWREHRLGLRTGRRPTVGGWRSSTIVPPAHCSDECPSPIGPALRRRSRRSTSTSTVCPGGVTRSGTPLRTSGHCSARCARLTPGGAERTITRMPGSATLWDVLPDGRLVIAHTDDRATMIGRRPDDVSERDLSWLDSSWAEDLSRDGRLVLFTESGQGGGPTVARTFAEPTARPAVRLSDGPGSALSPDARWAICVSASLPSPYLELVPTGAGDRRRLPDHGLVYTRRALASGRQADCRRGERARSSVEVVSDWISSGGHLSRSRQRV